MPDRLLSTAHVAAQIGVTARQVRGYIDRGQLPAQRLGGQWIVQESDLIQFQRPTMGRPKKGQRHVVHDLSRT